MPRHPSSWRGFFLPVLAPTSCSDREHAYEPINGRFSLEDDDVTSLKQFFYRCLHADASHFILKTNNDAVWAARKISKVECKFEDLVRPRLHISAEHPALLVDRYYSPKAVISLSSAFPRRLNGD